MALLARMQAVIPYATMLPTDVVTNTLWFQDTTTNTDLQVFADATNPAVQAFYDAVYGGTVPNYLANPGTWEARWYSMTDPPPRFPYILPLVATSKSFGNSTVPTEVACVLSFQGDPVAGTPQARRRGRIYLGALPSAAIASSSAGPPPTFPTISAPFRTTVQAAAGALLTATTGKWVVNSTTGSISTPVTNGWIDDTPDTQRRRGVNATLRTLWD